MRHRRLSLTVLKALLASLLCLMTVFAYGAEKLTVSWEDYPPYQFQSASGKVQGIDIEIALAVLNKAGFEVELKKMPWKRVLNVGLKNGEIDIALDATLTDERERFAYYSSVPYHQGDTRLFIREADIDRFKHITKLEDIIEQDITVGVTIGSIYSKKYEELLNNPNFYNKLRLSTKSPLNLRMLQAGRLDAVLDGHMAAMEFIDQQASSIKIIPLPINNFSDGIYFMFSKASVTTAQVDRINKALIELKQQGVIQLIIDKYFQTASDDFSP